MSAAGSPRTDTPETCQWDHLDNMHDLSQVGRSGWGLGCFDHGHLFTQTSLGSPGTPPPTLVVSGSPKLGLKSSETT